jgi:hypothetical protein
MVISFYSVDDVVVGTVLPAIDMSVGTGIRRPGSRMFQ